MARSAAAGDVRIDLTADASQAVAEFRKFGSEAEKNTKAYQAGFDAAQKRATRSMRTISKGTNTMTAGFQQAGTAISGAAASVRLFGNQGNDAVNTLTAALASMAAQGFNPLGIAIGVASGALAYFVGQSMAAEESTEELNKELERQQKLMNDLRQDAGRAALELRAAQAGISADEQRRQEQLERAERELELLGRAIARREERARALQAGETGLAPGIGLLELEKTERSLERLNKSWQRNLEIVSLIDELRADTATKEQIIAEQTAKTTASAGKLFSMQAEHNRAFAKRQSYLLQQSGILRPGGGSQDLMAEQISGYRAFMEERQREREAFERDMIASTQTLDQAMGSWILDVEKAQDEVSELSPIVQDVGETFTSSLGQGIADAVVDAEKLSDVLRNIGRTVLSTAINLGIQGAVGGFLGLPGFATGGSFTVGGYGGTDSQLVAFKATPGEEVHVNRPGEGRSEPAVVNVINATGERVRTEQRGNTVDVLIGAVAKDIAKGGKVAQAMEQGYSVRRSGRGR